ncbi:mannitol dehydrogenase family protein [Microbacterium sp. AGC62]
MTALRFPDRDEKCPTQPLNATTVAEALPETVPRPPVRIVHIGLGAFHRAHQLWYTAVVDGENEWGVAAFTGRGAAAARMIAAQNGLCTVVQRAAGVETRTLVTNLVEAHHGSDVARLATSIADPAVRLVTLTITEAGYRFGKNGRISTRDPVLAGDLTRWKRASADEVVPELQTALVRLLWGLNERRRSTGRPIAIVPCDNMPENGPMVGRAAVDLAREVDNDLADWVRESVSFVSTVVDRITPATTERDIRDLQTATGFVDQAVVVTEAFSEWILSGTFPEGRPPWELAGARFVDDIAPFERRKLWLLNGAHTLLAMTARHRGLSTVAEAITDPETRRAVEDYWDAVVPWLPEPELDLEKYRRDLLARFENPHLAHRLEQIALGSVMKLRIRTLPVIECQWGMGVVPEALLLSLSGWIAGAIVGWEDNDDNVLRAVQTSDPVCELLKILDDRLGRDDLSVAIVRAQVAQLLSTHTRFPSDQGVSRDYR